MPPRRRGAAGDLMPCVELITGAAYYHRIDTRSWPMIHGWLAEWLPLLQDQAPLRVRIMPLVVLNDSGQITSCDWLADNRAQCQLLDITGCTAQEAGARIEQWGGQLQRWIDTGADPREVPR